MGLLNQRSYTLSCRAVHTESWRECGGDHYALDFPFRTARQETLVQLYWVGFSGMVYYDRSIDAELANALAPDGSLAWLMAHVHSDMGCRCHAHLEFRKTRSGNRQRGSVQLYCLRMSRPACLLSL